MTDYQELHISKTSEVRYSSDFRHAGENYYISAKTCDTTNIQHKATVQRDPAQYPALGGIVLKKLPTGWQAAKPDFNVHGSAKMFTPQKDDSCAIAMVYDVLRHQFRPTMKRLLESPAKPVGDKDLEELIGLIPDHTNKKDVELISAYTKTIDGKRVLVVEEKNIAINRYYYFVYSADKDVAFESYTKIWFVAPIDALDRYKKEAIESINSLKFI